MVEAVAVELVIADEIDEDTIEATTDSVVFDELLEIIEATEAAVLDSEIVVDVVVIIIVFFASSMAFTFSMTLVTSSEVEDDREFDLKAEDMAKVLRIGRLPKAVNDLDPVNDGCDKGGIGSTVAVSTFSSLMKITLSLLEVLMFRSSSAPGELALLGDALSSSDNLGTWCSTLISYVAMVFTAALNLGDGKEILLAKFCIKCGLRILAKKLPALRCDFAHLLVEAADASLAAPASP